MSTTAKKVNVRTLTCTAILGALSFVLMFFSFSIPLAPSFLKMDISDLPALIAAFALGPASGACVCIIKNLLHMTISETGFVGELSNMLLGCGFVIPAGLIYKKYKGRKGAVAAALIGDAVMAILSLPVNYLLVYPMYINVMGFPLEAIMGMYNVIVFFKHVDTLLEALTLCNIPFTFVKGLLDVVITFVIYKKISPILKGKH